MGTENSRLEALRKRAAQINAQIAEAEKKQKAKARKDETRLKVLVGAAFLADIAKNPDTDAAVRSVLKRGIVNPKDKEFLKSKGWL
jgi:hypothetical protein